MKRMKNDKNCAESHLDFIVLLDNFNSRCFMLVAFLPRFLDMIVIHNYLYVNKIRKHKVNIYIKIEEGDGEFLAKQRRN